MIHQELHAKEVSTKFYYSSASNTWEPRPPHVEDCKMVSPRPAKRKKKDVDYSRKINRETAARLEFEGRTLKYYNACVANYAKLCCRQENQDCGLISIPEVYNCAYLFQSDRLYRLLVNGREMLRSGMRM
ncbi:hypothetical protein RF11_07490 [Thelohanellus kitauei]|uniref:Uncharacterized protein n=1 Tax=Thelohanellus kitauei TaxID=669202 RepID=A0A0C2J101_THEKT|nr:hypothetical protein RF11_07490 [Thelohanellus kitauei]